ncbi:tRNA lysidine(34) synthetase TilS [Actinokineospora globicatena]|uniref:tRNA lysidine(34) synthetase TilS n=1 Tax=Actinokineospora globicatena TaxID=103729 RepID=UPI0020A50B91|nr:tRNA lysidine(34) synthetase TilS [Actinokineospora globicatena]MCP2300924.1 tRNA(Ile)-lysidine synthase [Actinokineospora globicatena]GLW77449.1 tRNA(Ile)-lysidine synthase [Actinokineospora globicatena]GLW84283.1 tRNA(Ile)-lysidine synthase [Actinokineospora globicatena]
MSTGKPHPAVADVRRAVRDLLDQVGPTDRIAVAVSGGADSLALAAAAAHVGHKAGLTVVGLIVDHGLQPESARTAARAAEHLTGLGLDDVHTLPVVVDGKGGLEAAARRARYAALRSAAADSWVLLGHTRDDQAETVLLGLGRGSGPRSIAGMRPLDHPWARPLLDIPRATTQAACDALGITAWQDPHNTDPRFTRVRLRHEVLPLLDDVLQGGVSAALARTAAQLRDDLAALDAIAAEAYDRATEGGDLVVAELTPLHPAVRRRVLRTWLTRAGAPELTDAHLRGTDALVSDWHGQRGIALPGGLVARRARGRLTCTGREV